MTLLNLKPSTIDMDFTGPRRDIEDFRKAEQDLHHGFRTDSWPDGQIFAVMLPSDYLSKSSVVNSGLKKVRLHTLSLVDIVVTKTARLNERDWQDIGACIAKGNLTEEEILARKAEVEYAGNEQVLETNIHLVIDKFFRKKATRNHNEPD